MENIVMGADNEKKASPGAQSRRDFLKASAVAAATAATGNSLFTTPVYGQKQAPFLGSVLGANDRLTCAFVGVGGQGYNAHLKNVKEKAGEFNAAGVAVCDVWSKRTERAREELGLRSRDAYDDYRRVIERRDVDTVFIGTVDHWHAPIAISAMQAGKHVYVEKPLTRYLPEAFEVYDAAKRTGKVVQVGSQYCSEGKWQKAAEMIRAGKIGKLTMAQDSYTRNNPNGEWNYEIDPELTASTLAWTSWLGPVRNRPFSADHYFRWRKYYPYCAGILGDLLAHRIHPLMLATGNPEFPTRVASIGTLKVTPDRDVPDNVSILAEFPSGLTMLVIGSTVNEQGLGQVIRGHEGTLYFAGTRLELRPERPFADLVDREEFPDVQPGVNVINHIGNFFDAIRAGDPLKATGNIELGIRAQTVISMAEMSDRKGEMLHFDEATRTMRNGSGLTIEPMTYATEPASMNVAAS
jgi:predicted dehydrogenase